MKKLSDSDRRGFFSPSGLSGPGYLMTGKDVSTKRWVHYYVPSRSEEKGDSEARRRKAYADTRDRGIVPHSLVYVEERPAGYDPTTGLPDEAVRKRLAHADFLWGVRCFVGCLPPLLGFLAVLTAIVIFLAWISPPGAGLSPSERRLRNEQIYEIHRGPR